ncbi:MAG: glycosyltransferase [Planctomycetota bacterium]
MTAWQLLLLGLYVPLAALLTLYGVHRVHMLVSYLWHRRRNPSPNGVLRRLPTVLVQIPVFNERTVVERILKAVARFDYPRSLLSVQVLDDSTDETVGIARRACGRLAERGLEVEHVHRDRRDGFKAGALANGLRRSDADLVAIFDADFVPRPDFLQKLVPYFADARVGCVQARWEHLNLGRNLLTRIQTFFLDGHFILEHSYRHRTGRIFNFNGTAGIWRRSCIDDAGGWSANSITEDTEISFRAQLRGWRFVYLRDETCPAEVPADIDAYKGQQHRWAKGYTEVLRQHFGTIWRASIPVKAKVEATLMLSNHFAFLLLGALTILHLPVVLVRAHFGSGALLGFLDLAGLNLALFAFFVFYAVSQWEAGRFTLRRLALLPLSIGLGMALMVNSSRAVLESLFGVRTGFVRTPKEGRGDDGRESRYRASSAFGQALVEVAFGAYLLGSSAYLLRRGHIGGVGLTLLVAWGFLYLGFGTLRNRLLRPSGPAPEPLPVPEAAPATESA